MFDADGNFLEDLVSSGAGGLMQPNAVVLREETPSSSTEVSLETAFVYPTSGTTFYLDSLWTAKIRQVEVFNAAGQMVFQSAETGATEILWDARQQSPGMYVITARTVDGQALSQKVVVGE